MAVEIGQAAPDFELTNQDRKQVKLSDFRGKNVVLIFHPLAFTNICEGELCTIRDNYGRYQGSETEVVVISVDSPAVHKAWAEQLGTTFPYLSDFWPHGAVAKQYGVFNEKLGISKRGTFFINKEGTVTDLEVNEVPDGRDVVSYIERIGVPA